MGKPTVAELDERITTLEKNKPNIYVAAGTVWSYQQLIKIIDEYNHYGELVKLELTIDHGTDKDGYHYIIWHYELLNREGK